MSKSNWINRTKEAVAPVTPGSGQTVKTSKLQIYAEAEAHPLATAIAWGIFAMMHAVCGTIECNSCHVLTLPSLKMLDVGAILLWDMST